MKKILVTGNNGLLGRVVVKALEESNQYSPVLFKTTSRLRDIRKRKDCEEALEGVDGVIHLASCQNYKNVSCEQYNDVNVVGTYLLRKTALEKGIKSFIYTSSQDIYDRNLMPDTGYNENSKVSTSSKYAESKLNAEKKLMELNTSGLVIFRLSVILGNWLVPDSFFHFIMNSLRTKKKLNSMGKVNVCMILY